MKSKLLRLKYQKKKIPIQVNFPLFALFKYFEFQSERDARNRVKH